MDPLDQIGDPSKGQYGVLKIQTSPLGNESTSGNTELNGKSQYMFQYMLKYLFIYNSKLDNFSFRDKSIFAVFVQ